MKEGRTMMGQRFRYCFQRGDEGLEPRMSMRKPVNGGEDAGAGLEVPTVMNRGQGRYVSPAGSASRKATVKTKVVHGGKAVREHARYVLDKGAGRDGQEPRGFDAARDDVDLKAMAAEWSEDRHSFQTILSPRDGNRLDMTRYTRAVVAAWKRDLGTPLTWGAVIHYDTEYPHAHILIRGLDNRGGDLVIDRDYIRHGMRTRAMEAATRELGPRPAHEIAADLGREAGQAKGLGKQAGWQLHLNVSSERRHPTTQAVMKDLADRGLFYRMDFSGKDTRTLTVSVGCYDEAVAVARELDARFGDRIPDQGGKVARDDVRLSGPVWGAFSAQGDREFTRWTVKGLPLEKDAARELGELQGPEKEARRGELREAADAKLLERYGEFYAGTERVQAVERLQELQRTLDRGHGH
jgi:hypothetical protein